jgi:hypothetical protein
MYCRRRGGMLPWDSPQIAALVYDAYLCPNVGYTERRLLSHKSQSMPAARELYSLRRILIISCFARNSYHYNVRHVACLY